MDDLYAQLPGTEIIHGDATEGYYQRRGYTTDPDNIWMYKTDL